MKKFLLGTVGVMALGLAPAMAADLPARAYTKAPPMIAAIYDWSGFYIGANAGWGSARDSWNTLAGFDLGSHDATGAVAGGQIGYRWQAASWVFGLEAQGNWADLSGSHIDNGNLLATQTDHSKLTAFGLFTGQVGYAWNNALLYVKGGAAVTSTKYDAYTVAGSIATNDQTRWGGTVGVGFEYGFAPNWSVGVEYNHIFTSRFDATFYDAAGNSQVGHVGGDVDLVTARLNYRWGGPVVARY